MASCVCCGAACRSRTPSPEREPCPLSDRGWRSRGVRAGRALPAERCQPRRCAARERLHELPLSVVVPGQRYLFGGSERRFRRVISSSREDKPATWEEVAYEYQCCGTDLKTLVTTSSCGTGEGRVVSGERLRVKLVLATVKLELLCCS